MKIETTVGFDKWLEKLKDVNAKVSILTHINRMKNGNIADALKDVANAISRLKVQGINIIIKTNEMHNTVPA